MTPARRRLIALATGCALAGVLAVVLFVGVGTGAGSPAAQDTGGTVTNRAPGIDEAAANLMQLNVVSDKQAQPAPDFSLTDQHGRPTTLSQFRGKVVVWSLNDDQCTDLCTLLAETIIAANRDLGPAAKDVVYLGVNANPFYTDPSYLRSWSTRNDLEPLPGWVYVTGTPAQLQKTWNDYKVTVIPDARTRTVTHDALLEFIDPSGRARSYGYFNQGAISTAYYARAMAQMVDDLLPKSDQVKVGGPDVNASATRGASVGSPAPGFDLRPLGNTTMGRLGQLDQKPLVVNFWASTCSACVNEMPDLERVAKAFGSQINLVGVDVADPGSAGAAFARARGATYPLLADPDGATAASYRVAELPVTFIIAPGGSILARHEGALTTPQLEAVLQEDFQQLETG